MKINADAYRTHKPFGQVLRVSRLRENLTSGSDGEGLETGRSPAPRQSFTRQRTIAWIGSFRRLTVGHENHISFLWLPFILLALSLLSDS